MACRGRHHLLPWCRRAIGKLRKRGQLTPPTFLMLLAFSCPVMAAAPTVLLSTTTLMPGQTLRVEIDGLMENAKPRVLFMGKSYSFFVIGPNAQRALIGVRLDAKPGS